MREGDAHPGWTLKGAHSGEEEINRVFKTLPLLIGEEVAELAEPVRYCFVRTHGLSSIDVAGGPLKPFRQHLKAVRGYCEKASVTGKKVKGKNSLLDRGLTVCEIGIDPCCQGFAACRFCVGVGAVL